jgi:RsiW-degrading membrane proteinase PrsW (M82 family)
MDEFCSFSAIHVKRLNKLELLPTLNNTHLRCYNMSPNAITSIMLVAYAVVLCWLLKRVQTNKKLIILIAGIGMFFGFFSYILIGILSSIELQFNDMGFIRVLLIAPVQEEIAKFFCFSIGYVLIIRITKRWRQAFQESPPTTTVWDWVTLGAFVGLFFAAFENIVDYANQTAFSTLERTLTTWLMHMGTIGISAYGFYKYRKNSPKVVVFIILAVVTHSLFNLIVNL